MAIVSAPTSSSNPSVLQGLEGNIGEIPKTGEFRSGIFGAVIVLLLLFLLYVSALAVLFWALLNLGGALVTFGGQQTFGFIFLPVYLIGFLVVGAVFLAFLKPLMIRQTPVSRMFQLHPKQEPLLFEFVQKICQAVGAKPPSRIYAILGANAAASLTDAGEETELYIGLPLVYGLNTRQLAGVLAHEFGHFSQVGGMKVTRLVHSMLNWFLCAAFERDWVDEKIRHLSENGNGLVRIIFYVVRRTVWLARIGMVGLAFIGRFFLARLMQQMEFDADRYEARLSGSQSFAQTSRRMLRLAFSESQALEELEHQRKISQLPDNLPLFIADIEHNLKGPAFREVEEKRLNDTTGWSDTHPCDRDRIENAARENAAGIYHTELPSTVLFSDIHALGAAITIDTYRDVFGSEFNMHELNDTRTLVQSKQVVRSDQEAALRFVFEQFTLYDTFLLTRPSLGKAMDNDTYLAATHARRKQLLDNAAAFAKLVQQEENAWIEWSQAVSARTLMEAGFNQQSVGSIFRVRSIQEANQQATFNSNKLQQLTAQLRRYRETIGERLLDGLEYMRSEQVALNAGEAANVADEINLILQIWGTIVSRRDDLEQFFLDFKVVDVVANATEDQFDHQTLHVLQNIGVRVNTVMFQLQQATLNLTYPFEHGLGRVSVAHFLLPKLPVPNNLGETFMVASDLRRNLDYLLRRCMSRLCRLTEKVEAAFGLEPIETPAEITGMVKAREENAGNARS